MEKIITRCRISSGTSGNSKFLFFENTKDFNREVKKEETPFESVIETFKPFGLDVSELITSVDSVSFEGLNLILEYELNVDYVSLLEFLTSDEGKKSGLKLDKE